MMLKQALFILFSLLLLPFCSIAEQKAVISVPIADLVGQPMADLLCTITPNDAYAAIPICGGATPSDYACPRLHQLLYNDIVTVEKYHKNEACIRIAHTFYITQSSCMPQTCYWTLTKNITLLDTITTQGIAIEHLPEQIHFSDRQSKAFTNKNIITLTQPHYDKTLDTTFSVGTRFVRAPHTKKRNTYITVFATDYTTMHEHRIKIPTYKCMIFDENKTKKERIADYVNLLKKWAHQKNGSIAYVWGGTSFMSTINKPFTEVFQTKDGKTYSFYQHEDDTSSPKNGFDCSGLITRATQICAIPYFCKNTTTIAHCLKPLTKETALSEGDLILIKGHVMVVSDIQKNLLIEARSYGHGYGKLHEIPLNKVFEGINTYQDLLEVYFSKKPIKRKDIQGMARDTFANVQLLSMESVWEKAS